MKIVAFSLFMNISLALSLQGQEYDLPAFNHFYHDAFHGREVDFSNASMFLWRRIESPPGDETPAPLIAPFSTFYRHVDPGLFIH